jgi:LysR family glycine cleavage system transcriptional activator
MSKTTLPVAMALAPPRPVHVVPRRRLPSLNAVRAFEAAARLNGFNAAGNELHVSANAIGRLVKLLEESLGVTLFKRLSRGVVLTGAGERYLAGVGNLLDQLAAVTNDVRRLKTSQVLKVSAMPSMVSRWLIPRLGSLTEQHPELDVRVSASTSRTNFAREDIDVAIRIGTGRYDGLHADLLMHEDYFPVCSPKLLAGGPPLWELGDLAHHVLLHDQCGCVSCLPQLLDWQRWLAAYGITDIDCERGLRYTFSHMTLQAAAEGQGVALASSALLADDLATGRLVRPFGNLAVRSPYSFYLVCSDAVALSDKVALFRSWALAEATRTV